MSGDPFVHDPAGDAIEIGRLSALDDLSYARQKKASAARMGVPVAALDRQVRLAKAACRPPSATAAPEYSDDDLALKFTKKHANSHRYTAQWGKWQEWVGTHWQTDVTMRTFSLVREICRQESIALMPPEAKSLASSATVAAVEKLARSDRHHAASVDQWDTDPWLLATPGDTIDLRTGQARKPDPNDHCTKIAAVEPGGGCPQWLKFLDQATAGDLELQQFIQRMFGYALTGDTSEHALFFCYGTGGNGKGVLLNTMTGILGDYAKVSATDTFTQSNTPRHTTELAMLRGARLVTAQETEEGQAWAESRIKSLTGGDPITAHFMRQDDFTFVPQFKLIIAGNHKPQLKNVDEAIRRRLHMIPFTVTVRAEDRDRDLPSKLKAEWPGILAWAIQGCLEWQRTGLNAPDSVRVATDEYLTSEDALGLWIEESCTCTKGLAGKSSALFDSWKAWANTAGEMPGSAKAFKSKMETKGFRAKKYPQGIMFEGIALTPDANDKNGQYYD